MKKYSHLFDTEGLRGDLKARSIRGGVATTAATAVSYAMRLGSIAILARILMPESFGLVGMVTVVAVLAERFKDLGLSLATVQSKEIDHAQVSALFWVNTLFGILSMLLVSALSWPMAWFYGEPRIVEISLALSTGFLFGGLTVQHQALLRRQMRFGAMAWIQIVANVLSIAVALGVAVKGYQHWALVWKEVSRSVFVAVGTWLMCPWLPGAPRRAAGVGDMLRFGRDVTGFDLISYVSRGLDQVLIGKYWGATPLGFYRQAYQLMLLPLEFLRFPAQYVAEPALSALQNEAERYQKYFLKIVSIVSFAGMPLAVFLFLFCEKVVLLLLGPKWTESVAIFQVLSVGMLFQPVVNTCGFLMVTCGKTRRYFCWGVVNGTLLIAGFLIGIQWGPAGVAAGWSIAMLASFLFSLAFSFKDTPVRTVMFLKALWPPVAGASGVAIFVAALRWDLAMLGRAGDLILSGILCLAIYLAVWMVIPGGRGTLLEYVSYPLSFVKAMMKNVWGRPAKATGQM